LRTIAPERAAVVAIQTSFVGMGVPDRRLAAGRIAS
jgi:hypothetical protein